MNVDALRAGLLAAAVLLAVGGILADTNTESAVPLAVGAGVAVAAFAALSVIPRTRFARPTFVQPPTDPLVALSRAFRSGPLGRQRVAAAILELERETLGRPVADAETTNVRRPEDQTPAQFREWAASRLDELEAAT